MVQSVTGPVRQQEPEMGGTPLRVLFIEDSQDDERLVALELEKAGYHVAAERVETDAEMAAALDRGPWDLVLADYSLPRFTGPAALALIRSRELDLPVIMISGSIDEEQAVESMRAGAHDFITKARLARLGPTVARELREAENRRARRRAEEERRAAEEKYRALLEQMPALAYLARADSLGRTVFVGPQIEEMTGYRVEEWVGDPELWSKRLHPEDRDRVLEEVQRTGSSRRPFVSEYRLLRRDGQVVWWRHQARFVRVPAGGRPLLHGFVQDVTEHKRVEDEVRRQRESLHQAEKLAAMGQLLAGVAHELNNPLAVVIGQALLLQRDAGSGPGNARIEKVVKAAERCGRIVNNFLALARHQPPERRRIEVNPIVEDALELLAYPLRVDGIEVRLDLGPRGNFLEGDPHQLQQVLINLLTNAHHALRQVAPPRRITVTTRASADRITIEVSDNGPGIPPELAPRIFEPFFTTKAAGEGTGLGLPLSRSIVAGHGGTISMESTPGSGASFRVELPVSPPSQEAEPAEAAAAGGPPGPRMVLVVDDEPAVADVLADLLRQDGHQVDVAADGVAALAKLEAGRYDLVVSDLRMPHLDGPGLYEEATRRKTRARFVFVTGDTLTPRTRQFLERSRVPHFGKPFSPEDVRRAVREALDGR